MSGILDVREPALDLDWKVHVLDAGEPHELELLATQVGDYVITVPAATVLEFLGFTGKRLRKMALETSPLWRFADSAARGEQGVVILAVHEALDFWTADFPASLGAVVVRGRRVSVRRRQRHACALSDRRTIWQAADLIVRTDAPTDPKQRARWRKRTTWVKRWQAIVDEIGKDAAGKVVPEILGWMAGARMFKTNRNECNAHQAYTDVMESN